MESIEKQCTQCKVRRPLSDFPTFKSDPSRTCKACNLCRSAIEKYRAKNRDSILSKRRSPEEKAKTRALSQSYLIANREKIVAYKREWRRRNPDKCRAEWKNFYARHPDRCKEKSDRWRRENLSHCLERERRRRAKIANVTVGDVEAIRTFYAMVRSESPIPCHWCGKKTKKGDREVDHIIPVSRGGPHAVENLCCACWKCNNTKRAKLPEEFCGQYEIAYPVGASQ